MAFGDVTPACTSYASGSTKTIVEAVEGARKDRLADVDEFVSKRYGPQQVAATKAVHQSGGRSPDREPLDVVVAVTARAKSITHQDARVEAKRSAAMLTPLADRPIEVCRGKILGSASAGSRPLYERRRLGTSKPNRPELKNV